MNTISTASGTACQQKTIVNRKPLARRSQLSIVSLKSFFAAIFTLLMVFCTPLAMKGQQTNTLLSQNFDGSGFSISAGAYDASGWYTYNAGSGNNWIRYQEGSSAHSASYDIKYGYSSSYAANCYLVSEPFSVSAGMSSLSVSLYEKVASSYYSEIFEVFFVKASDVSSSTPIPSTTNQYQAIASTSYTNTSWAEQTGSVTSSNLAGQSVRVVVHCTSAKDMYNLFIDDITVTETVQLTGPYIMLDPTSATVLTGFTQNLTATYGNVTNPTITYTSSNTNVATVSSSGTTATVTAVSAGTATITATMNGSYTATCAITVEDPSYCTPGTGNWDGDGIYNVAFGTSPSVNNTVAGIAYGDYSNLVGKVSAGANCQVDITYKTGYTYGTIIWVDWNQNYIFEGTEAVYAGESGDANPTTLNATFTVPANTPAGDYRMRIIGADQALDSYTGSLSSASNVDPCGTFNWSTCHDYTLRVSSDPSISLNPTTLNLSPGSTATLTATKVNDGGATITWSSSNTGVATVSGSGTSATVTAVRDGTATITASMTVNGVTYSATCDVTVESCGTIGTGTSADNRVPINTYYNYFTTQSLYTASEINAAIGSNNLINSLSFYHNEYSATYSISIYLAHTTQTALSASSAVTSATLVYSGSSITVGGNAAGWQTFDLDTPFEYNGTDNLLVIVCGSGSYNTSLYWQYTTTSSSAPSLSRGDDNASGYADLSNTSYSYSTYSYRPNIKICGTSSGAYTITCATPSHGTLSADRNNADENDVVTITATPETDYLLTALTYTPEGGSAQNIDISSMPYTFTMPAANVTVNATFTLPSCPRPTNVTVSNLAPSHATVSWDSEAGNYTVKYSTATVTGTTLDPVFEDDFENGLGSWTIYAMGYDDPVYNWIQYDGTIVDEGNHTGDYVAASRSWHGSNGDQSVDNWLVTPQMTLGDAVKFWVACNDGYRDSYAVYVSTGSNVVTSSSSIGDFVLVKSYAEATGTWTEIPVDISAYAGQQGYVAIRHTNYGGDHILVDDFGVYNTINTYSYEGWTTVSPNPTTESCQITGLSAETLYAVQVQANCGGSDGSSAWSTIYFTTPDNCGAPQELASSNITSTTAALAWADDKESYNLRYRKVYYYEDFESSDGIPAGWTTINNSSTAGSLNWQVMHMTNHSGNNSLGSGSYIYQNSGITPDNWLISPQLDLQGTLRVWLSGYPSAGDRYREHFAIYISTSGNSVSNFTTTLVSETTTTDSYVEYTADLSSYAGQSGYIAIRHFNCSDQNYLCVDDFGLYGSENWVSLSPNPTTETANLTGLTTDTGYEWQVQGINCDGNGGLTSWSATNNFKTLKQYTVSLSANPTAGGTVSGDGTYDESTDVTITATPATGYCFKNWTEDGSEVSTSASYTFIVTSARTLVANFTHYLEVSDIANVDYCVTGDHSSVSASPAAGSGDYTYTWQKYNGSSWVGAPDASNSYTYNPPYSTTGTVNYRVSVADNNGCAGHNSVVKEFDVKVSDVPSITLSVPAKCSGEELILSPTVVNNGKDIISSSYQISSNNSDWDSFSNGSAVTDEQNNYYIKYTAENGCGYSSKTVQITVHSLPDVPAISGPTAVCPGKTARLTTPEVSGVTFSWNGGSYGSSREWTTPAITSTTAFTLVAKSTSNSCTSQAATKEVSMTVPTDDERTAMGIEDGYYVWTGNNSNWNGTNNWMTYSSGSGTYTIAGNPTNTTNVVIGTYGGGACASGSPTLKINEAANANNLIVGNGITVSATSKTLTVAATLTNNGTINGTKTIKAQNMTNNGTVDAPLTVSVTLTNNGTINGTKTLTMTGTGNLENNGTFNAPVVFKGITTLSGSRAPTFTSVTVNSSKKLITGTQNIIIAGTCTNGGTITAGTGTITMTGDLTNNKTFTAGDGNITMTGNLTNTSKFTAGAGNITITGDLTNSGSTFTTGAGALSLTGDLTNTGTITIGGTGAVTLEGDWVNSGTFKYASSATGSITMTGNLTNTSTGAFTAGKGAISLTGDLANSGTFKIGSTGAVTLEGNWVNDGAFNHTGAGAVIFVGTSAQTIGGTSATAFNNVTFNNANGIEIGKEPIINGTATFSAGVVTGDMTFASGASVSGASTSSYVNGKVTKNGMASSFCFPTGTASLYAPFEATSSSASNVSVQYASGHTDMPDWWNHSGNLDAVGLSHASDRENWQISASATTNLSSIKLYWNAGGDHSFEEGNAALSSYLNVAAVQANGFRWQNLGRASVSGSWNGSGSITASNPLEITVGAKAAGDGDYFITFASSNKGGLLLPIELTSFTATCNGKYAELEWSTASERNNDYFVIERSDDAINFTEIARVAGAGNSIEQLDYTYNDYGIHGGDNYYRLVQVDYDGTRTVSDIVVANCIDTEVGEPEVMAYPNPFSGELTIVLDNFDNRPATIEVYDMLGQQVLFQKADAPQNNYETILNLSNLPPAAYTVRVSTTDFVINKQVVKN